MPKMRQKKIPDLKMSLKIKLRMRMKKNRVSNKSKMSSI